MVVMQYTLESEGPLFVTLHCAAPALEAIHREVYLALELLRGENLLSMTSGKRPK